MSENQLVRLTALKERAEEALANGRYEEHHTIIIELIRIIEKLKTRQIQYRHKDEITHEVTYVAVPKRLLSYECRRFESLAKRLEKAVLLHKVDEANRLVKQAKTVMAMYGHTSVVGQIKHQVQPQLLPVLGDAPQVGLTPQQQLLPEPVSPAPQLDPQGIPLPVPQPQAATEQLLAKKGLDAGNILHKGVNPAGKTALGSTGIPLGEHNPGTIQEPIRASTDSSNVIETNAQHAVQKKMDAQHNPVTPQQNKAEPQAELAKQIPTPKPGGKAAEEEEAQQHSAPRPTPMPTMSDR